MGLIDFLAREFIAGGIRHVSARLAEEPALEAEARELFSRFDGFKAGANLAIDFVEHAEQGGDVESFVAGLAAAISGGDITLGVEELERLHHIAERARAAATASAAAAAAEPAQAHAPQHPGTPPLRNPVVNVRHVPNGSATRSGV